jgi:hypothetical protein
MPLNSEFEPTRRRFLGTAAGVGAAAVALSATRPASASGTPTPNPPGDQWPITEPYPVLNGGRFSGPRVRASDDPLVRYRWTNPNAGDGLQVYQLRPVTAVADVPESFSGLESVTTPECNVLVKGTGSIRFDFGVESPAWLEFDSPDFSGAVEMSISEYNQPAVVNPGPAHPVKTLAPVRYSNTFRLELNSELYEGVRFGWIHVRTFDQPWHITAVRVVSQVKPTNYVGTFRCSDEMLTRIWYTGAYSVKANLYSDYFGAILMDRGDRFAWAGDCHTAQAAALVAFGDWDFVRENLIGTADVSNGIESYSLYWVLSLLDYYQHTGDATLLKQYSASVVAKLDHADAIYADPYISFYGHDERLGACFEEPDIFETKSAYRMLFIRTCWRFAAAMATIGDHATATTYENLATAKTAELKADPTWYEKLGVHALSDAVNAGCVGAAERAAIIEREFADRLNRLSYSPFNQYFILQALAGLNRYDDAVTTVRDIWGGQIEYGGTLFFEVFRPDWLTFREPNDRPPDCQVGYTSMGHAWGTGVTAWLSHEILGITPTSPGFASVDVVPHLGRDLTWVEGSIRTPGGDVSAHFDLRSGRCVVRVPPGSVARVGLPVADSHIGRVTVGQRVVWDGQFRPVPGIGGASADDDYVYLEGVEPGDWRINVFYTSKPDRSPAPPQPFYRPVRFAGEDIRTGGDWPGRYGGYGYVLFDYDGVGRNRELLPGFVRSVTPAATRAFGNCLHGPWASGTTDRRALAPDADNGAMRNLGVVYTSGWPLGETMTVDIATTPGMRYQLALYCVDWDRQDRQQVIEVFDLQTLKLVAPVRLVERFAEGKYLLYECDRSVRLRFDLLNGDNAVLSGLFFDPIANG